MHYTPNECEVMPYSDEHEVVKDVPVVKAVTGYTSTNRRTYILILNKVLYMPKLSHTLINPNQLRHHNAIVRDDPYATEGMWIESLGGE